MSEEQAQPQTDQPNTSPYTREQKIAMTSTMLTHLSSDLGQLAKAIIDKDNGNGAYEISYETVAIMTAKLTRAQSNLHSLAKLFEGALPKDANAADIAASAQPAAKTATESILGEIQKAVVGNTKSIVDTPANG